MAEGGVLLPQNNDNVIKQGYLKKCITSNDILPSASKQLAHNFLQKLEPFRWYVFVVRQARPYLEYYDNEEKVFCNPPINSHNLSSYQSISYTLGRENKKHNFVIHLADGVFEFAAPKRALMVGWCRTLERSLHSLGLGNGSARDDHHYSAFPVKKQEERSVSVPIPLSPDTPTGIDALVFDEMNAGPGVRLSITSSDDDEEEETSYEHMPIDMGKGDEDGVFELLNSVRRDETTSGNDASAHEKEKPSEGGGGEVVMRRRSLSMLQESDTSEDDHVPVEFWIQHRKTAIPDLYSLKDIIPSTSSITPALTLPVSSLYSNVQKTHSESNKAPPALPPGDYDFDPPPLPQRPTPDKLDRSRRCVSMMNPKFVTIPDSADKAKTSSQCQSDLNGHDQSHPPPLPRRPGGDTLTPTKNEPQFKIERKISNFHFDKTGQTDEGDYEPLETTPTPSDENPFVYSNKEYETSWDVKKFKASLVKDQGKSPDHSKSACSKGEDSANCREEVLRVKLPRQNGHCSSEEEDSGDDEEEGNLYSEFPDGTHGLLNSERSSFIIPQSQTCQVTQSKKPSDLSQSCREFWTVPLPEKKSGQSAKEKGFTGEPSKDSNSSSVSKENGRTKENKHASPTAPPRRKKIQNNVNSSASGVTNTFSEGKFTTVIDTSKKKGHGFSKSISLDVPEAPPPPPRSARLVRSVTNVDDFIRARPRTTNMSVRSSTSSDPVHVMKLKHLEMDNLRAEIDTGGIVRTISRVHFQHGLALVECFDKIWIAGWDLKKYPRLHGKFHIGDEVLMVNDVQLTSLSFGQKLVKNVKADIIEVTVRRLPNAKVFAIQRSAEGQNLGLKRDGGEAEIVYVDPFGLANAQGLTNKTTNMAGTGVTNWCLTEINNRPLNLFFKDSEIEHRLSAVGKDISLVVQPADFIKDMKKHLKKIRGFKDFLVQ